MRRAPSWALGYAYAKAAGALARGYLGRGARELSLVRDARSLTRLVYPGPVPDLPESALVRDAEERLDARVLEEAEAAFWPLGRGGRLALEAALTGPETEAVRVLLRSALAKAPPPTHPYPSFPVTRVNALGYPDLEAMFATSIFDWIPKAAAAWGPVEDNRLDREAFAAAWERTAPLRGRRGTALRQLMLREAELTNAVWVLRLRFTFGMREREIAPLLLELPGQRLTGAALQACAFAPDTRASFLSWRYARIVNPESEGSFWRIDPEYAERKARDLMEVSWRRAFHRSGPTETALYAYVRLRSRENEVLRAAYEALRMGMPLNLALGPEGEGRP